MQLTYRGIAYSLSSVTVSLDPSVKPIVGKYRGVPCSIQQFKPATMPRRTFNLKYRGAYYYPNSNYPIQSGFAAI